MEIQLALPTERKKDCVLPHQDVLDLATGGNRQ